MPEDIWFAVQETGRVGMLMLPVLVGYGLFIYFTAKERRERRRRHQKSILEAIGERREIITPSSSDASPFPDTPKSIDQPFVGSPVGNPLVAKSFGSDSEEEKKILKEEKEEKEEEKEKKEEEKEEEKIIKKEEGEKISENPATDP